MNVCLWCAPQVFLARVDDDVVMLNIDVDEYSCFIGAAEWLVPADDGVVHVPNETTADELVAAGIAVREPPSIPRRAPSPARRTLPRNEQTDWSAALNAGLFLLTATLAFRRKTLAQLLDTALPTLARESVSDQELSRILAAARVALPWIPMEGECLQRAYEFRWFLARQGVRTEWVFGVRTWPFAAHCWLQTDDLVIADSLERVGRFTPIMVV